MEHFVCYFNTEISFEEIQYTLAKLFNLPKQEIGGLLEGSEDIKVKYEILPLEELEKKGFFIELNIYAPSELSSSLGLYNNLLLANEIVSLTTLDILINDESNDPYQWILIKNTRRIFLVEEEESGKDYIMLKNKPYKELFFSRALKLLPSLNDVNKKLPVYFVNSPNLWHEAVKDNDSNGIN